MTIRRQVKQLEMQLRQFGNGSWGAATRKERHFTISFFAERPLEIEGRLARIEAAVSKIPAQKPKRAPTEWQRFLAAGMKAGKTHAEIGREWQERKAKAA